MKKIIVLAILLCTNIICITSRAEYTMRYEELPEDTQLELSRDTELLSGAFAQIYESNARLMTINDQLYIIPSGGRYHSTDILPTKVSPHESSHNLIWTGEYYYYRSSWMDGWPYQASRYTDIYLLDEDGEYVKGCTFDRRVMQIGYKDGTYYARLGSEYKGVDNIIESSVIKSTDFINWEDTDEEVPMLAGDITMAGDKIAVQNSDKFCDVCYESDKETSLYYGLGDWLINIDDENNLYFSNDNIYYVKVNYPEGYSPLKIEKGQDVLRCAYMDENNIILEWNHYDNEGILADIQSIIRLTVPRAGIIEELHNMKNAPYVVMNDQILAFETAPVIENDFTLVPMRFLFEQMGADVEWDDATQSATATLNNTAVTFSIDNTEAEVNNTSVTMDVPARLINGKTMVPLRFLSEELGYTVTWDEATHTAVIE